MIQVRTKLLVAAAVIIPITFSCGPTQRTTASEVAAASSAAYQANMSPQAKRLLQDLQTEDISQRPFVPSPALQEKYGLTRSGESYPVQGMIKVTEEFNRAEVEQLGVVMSPPAGNIIPVFVPVEQLPLLLQHRGIEYFELSGGAIPARD